jgi:hypothetical protein
VTGTYLFFSPICAHTTDSLAIIPLVDTPNKLILVIAYDRLGERQAGPAIRTLALANELATLGPVEVVFEGDAPFNQNKNITFVARDTIKPGPEYFIKFKAALIPPLAALTIPEIFESDLPIAVDLFDPVVWENLELHRDQSEPERQFQHERHLAALLAGIFRGDFFLVAGNRQRDLFLGALMVANRINPVTWKQRIGPDQIIGLVPFGLPSDPPPPKTDTPLPEGLQSAGPLVVWGGGMWDWLEPEIVVSAWPEVLKRHPNARLVFPGTEHPNPHVPVMRAVGRVIKIATELGVLDTVYFGKWFPRNEYLGLLANASCGVSAHSPGLESRYAARTRYLDAIWMGLPMVVSEGDEYADYISNHKLGVVVIESNPSDFAQGILRILETGRASLDENFARARQRLTWKRMAAPLVDWARDPAITHGPGSEFFQVVAGRAVPRGRPSDPMSIMRRIIARINKG